MAQISLSVVLPVYNAEQSLYGQVTRLLEILPDLTASFEILVVDGGSVDNTREIADDLARVFPQVRVTTHPGRLGERDLIEIGLAETAGETLFVQDQHAAIDSSKLGRLWELREQQDLILSHPEFQAIPPAMRGLAAWGLRLEEASPGGGRSGVQMVCRQSLTWTGDLVGDPLPSSRAVRRDPPGFRRDSDRQQRGISPGRSRSIPRY